MGWHITGAKVLADHADGAALACTDVALCGTHITRVGGPDAPAPAGTRRLDASGLWVLPGIIDVHGDGFERHLAPRRGMVSDLSANLRFVETELAACGITTAWLAQFWSWEGGMRGPDFATRLANALHTTKSAHRLDLRMQLRLETHMIADQAAVQALITDTEIDYLVFNDHLPHQALAQGKTPPRLNGSALKAGRSPQAHLDMMLRLAELAPQVAPFARKIIADNPHMRFGSHDDADAKMRDSWAALGASIAEFPVTRAAAEAAVADGTPVVMGAPNVLRGGSHNRGAVSATALVADGLVSALASDYHYPAMIGAAFALVEGGICDIAQAWHLLSAGPAQVMGLKDRGRIAEGQRADLILLCPQTRRVLGSFCAGAPVFLSGDLVERLE